MLPRLSHRQLQAMGSAQRVMSAPVSWGASLCPKQTSFLKFGNLTTKPMHAYLHAHIYVSAHLPKQTRKDLTHVNPALAIHHPLLQHWREQILPQLRLERAISSAHRDRFHSLSSLRVTNSHTMLRMGPGLSNTHLLLAVLQDDQLFPLIEQVKELVAIDLETAHVQGDVSKLGPC